MQAFAFVSLILMALALTAWSAFVLGLSDNVTYFAEQIDAIKASAYHYRVTFKPSVIVPNIEIR